MNSFGDRIRYLRKKHNLTQQELASKFYLNKSSISRYERGNQLPEHDLLEKIADYFNVSVDYLLGRTNIRSKTDAADKISESLNDDPELSQFWDALKEREDLKLLFKQTKDLAPNDVKKIIRIIKAIEDEEDRNDG
jgi:transcriptional regulator with XRE-family HTH domain